jgi:hypothetical protein
MEVHTCDLAWPRQQLRSWSQEPVHVGVGVSVSRERLKRWHDRLRYGHNGCNGFKNAIAQRSSPRLAVRWTGTGRCRESVPLVQRRKRRNGFGNQAPTVKSVAHLSPPPRHLQAKTDASVTIRLIIPPPVQAVKHI